MDLSFKFITISNIKNLSSFWTDFDWLQYETITFFLILKKVI